LLEQLLHLARIDSGKTMARVESIHLLPVVLTVQQKWETHAVYKNITFHTNVPREAMVRCDKFFLELMLDNLVNNAIKYGIHGGNVWLNWDNVSQTFSVRDDGIGIPEKDIPHIFNRFYRADESRSSIVKGSGLGLSIVQKLAGLQNIVLKVTSSEGKGATFSLRFPS
jgi:signal transduction histidine kinase